MINKILKEIYSHKNTDKAEILARFFKTGKGEYGAGDKFLGITVPIARLIAHKYGDLPITDVEELLHSKFHEVRMIALLILVWQYRAAKKRSDVRDQKKIVSFYLANTKFINNWDLVDLSAHYIVGDYLYNKDPIILYKLAKSKNLWERRIAIISTFAFIYKMESKYTINIAYMLQNDPQDLINKACGWMLREVGKRVKERDLIDYLDKNATLMPRTMLRYAIERLPEAKRQYYLKLK